MKESKKMMTLKYNTVFRSAAAIFLTLAMIVTFIPSMSETVYAVEVAQPPSSGTYIEVGAFNTVDTEYGLISGKTPQAVYFGTNGDSGAYGSTAQKQKWWIAGFDSSGLVLVCDPRQPLKTGQIFTPSALPKDYESAYGTYESLPANPVYPSHYGASELRSVLKALATDGSCFTTAEQGMMKETTIYTYDFANDTTYFTTDKLYPAAACYSKEEITVGQNRVDSSKSGNEQVDNGLKIGLKGKSLSESPFTDASGFNFWTRSPEDYSTYTNYALWANPSNKVLEALIDGTLNTSEMAVVPAFAFDTSTVLFASSAPAGETYYDAIEKNEPMTFRCDGTGRINSTATFTGNSVSVEYEDADTDLYLYVQGSGSAGDWVFSQKIEGEAEFPASYIHSGTNLTNCNVWLESVEDGIAYAKPASYTGAFPPPLYGIVSPPAAKSYVYTGKPIKGARAGKGYALSGPVTRTSVGSYIATATLQNGYLWSDGTITPKKIKWRIVKAANPMKLKPKTATVRKSKVKKKAQKLARYKVLTFTKSAKGKVTYKKLSGSSKLSIAKTTGQVTVKKMTKKGTYKIKVKVTAAGTSSYKALSKSVTVTVKVR